MPNIVNFPTQRTTIHSTHSTLAEADFHQAHFGLHLCDATTAPPSPTHPCLDLLDQATLAATRIELEIANKTNRERHRRLYNIV